MREGRKEAGKRERGGGAGGEVGLRETTHVRVLTAVPDIRLKSQ